MEWRYGAGGTISQSIIMLLCITSFIEKLRGTHGSPRAFLRSSSIVLRMYVVIFFQRDSYVPQNTRQVRSDDTTNRTHSLIYRCWGWQCHPGPRGTLSLRASKQSFEIVSEQSVPNGCVGTNGWGVVKLLNLGVWIILSRQNDGGGAVLANDVCGPTNSPAGRRKLDPTILSVKSCTIFI